MSDARIWSRREFLERTSSCAAHMSVMAAASPVLARRLWARQERFPVVAREAWGRIEHVDDGIWGMVSTPLQDRTTLCNGGIVAGKAGVVVVEAYGSDAGARWMAAQAKALTGRVPTHVVVTHYHSDHTTGLRGAFETPGVKLLSTTVTRDEVRDRNQSPPVDILEGAQVLDGRRPSEIDLGDRSVVVVPRNGHTDSDVSLEISDPRVIFTGDLVWNHMFPNYVDAIPSRLTKNVQLLRLSGADTYVPGHGPLADAADMDRYLSLLDDVEAAARGAMERGQSAEEAGAEYELPAGLGDWTLFNPGYFARAIGAWMKELGATE
ncbi:MAG: MBL fold metallo-hydrolase [Gemmatimonadetes bacterium]|nr:MBL fold metallo-hydrolase [Gemmatimonadota bacterium]